MEGGDRDERKEKLRERKLQREEKQTNTVEWRGEKENTIRRSSGGAANRQKEEKASLAQGVGKVGTGGRGPGSARRKGEETAVHRGGAKKEVREGGKEGWRGGIMRVAERRVLTTKPPGMDQRSQKTPSGGGKGGGNTTGRKVRGGRCRAERASEARRGREA